MNPVSCSVALGRLIFGGTRAKQCRSTLVALRLCTMAVSAQPTGRVDYAEPRIKQQPVGQMVGIGETAIFKVVMEDDSDPRPIDRQSRIYDPMFQWVKNGSKLEGATTTILTIRNAQPSDAGVYYLAINWSHDRATSAIVTLAVVASAPPAIAAHPTGGAFLQGRSVTLRVFASGFPAPKYQWRKEGREIPGATADSLTFSSLQPADAGRYEVMVSNPFATVQSRSTTLTVLNELSTAKAGAPAIVSEPQSLIVRRGDPAVFEVSAVGAGVTYQWFRDGAALAGATQPVLSLPAVSAADMGCYSVVARNDAGTTESQSVALAVPADEPSHLVNLSARGYVPADGTLTVGFFLRGTGAKTLLLRAAGPALSQRGVEAFLPAPRLTLRAAGFATPWRTNDDWDGGTDRETVAAATATAGAFAFARGSRDAAMLATLDTKDSRAFTLQISPAEPTSAGAVLAELYDCTAGNPAVCLAGVSILAPVGAGERTLSPGFTIAGPSPKKLLIRAIGPGLSAFGADGLMADPELSVTPTTCHTPIARNADWANSAEITTSAAVIGAFPLAPDSHDAAVLLTLPPGGYTVAVTGAGGSAGLVLVEIYDLDR